VPPLSGQRSVDTVHRTSNAHVGTAALGCPIERSSMLVGRSSGPERQMKQQV
jgi:hypothetical protein